MHKMHVVLIASLGLCATESFAKGEKVERPEIFSKLIECRTIADNAARLACYDRQTAALDEAERNASVMVVDSQQVKKANRSLFGLPMPSIGKIFRGGDDKDEDKEEIKVIESTIKSIATSQSGKYVFVIEDGARWVQTDTNSIRTPKPGQPIKIRKAALGSYFANVNGQAGIRVMRQQ